MQNNRKETVVSKEIFGKTITMKTGYLAQQANGSVLVTIEDPSVKTATEVLGVATMSKESKDIDFFPLSVDYIEKFYANGKIPGGYTRREGKPSDSEILVSRLIDRPIRPLFPKGFRNEVQVIPLVLGMDNTNPSDVLGMIAASSALAISDIPLSSPIGAVRVGYHEDKFFINPTYKEMESSKLGLLIAGTKKAITMIEGDASELSEEVILEGITLAHEAIKEIISLQEELIGLVGKEKSEVTLFTYNEDLKKELESSYYSDLKEALQEKSKKEREEKVRNIYKVAQESLAEKYAEDSSQIKTILHDFESDIVRAFILNDSIRPDGRQLDELRPLDCQVDVLKSAHGSAVFTRGETQALSVVSIGSGKDSQKLDLVKESYNKSFFLHYNFPPFSVGEVGRLMGVSRREVGHGMLAERSLAKVLDSNFIDQGYTIRVVSEVLESNGSSSMATVCAGSMSLMSAGVKLSNPVAGIAMGLILQDENYKILTDIQGMEDHLGDMDFKIAGTTNGITGFQLDIKVEGITIEIMKKALEQAKTARLEILKTMNEAIAESRASLNHNAPILKIIKVNPSKLKSLIGVGGKNIKEIVSETGSVVDIEDDGTVKVFADNATKMQETEEKIGHYTDEAKVGQIYEGKVRSIKPFGAFIEILPGTDGLCHVSEFQQERLNSVEEFVQVGDSIKVKVIGTDNGKISLSHKQI